MIGLVLSVTLVHVGLLRTGKQDMRYGPLFYGKQLKAFEFQLIVYDFKVGILAQPRLPDWHGRILEIWRALGRSATRTSRSGRIGFALWRFVGSGGKGGRRDMMMIGIRAGIANGGEEETEVGEGCEGRKAVGIGSGGVWNGGGRIVERHYWARSGRGIK